MLSIINGQAYLTTNILCSQNDHPSLVEKIMKERENLLLQASFDQTVGESQLYYTEEIEPEQWKKSVEDIHVIISLIKKEYGKKNR